MGLKISADARRIAQHLGRGDREFLPGTQEHLDAPRQRARADFRALQIRQNRERLLQPYAASRNIVMFCACSSWLPCEKFSRATSIPASISLRIIRGVRVAGPMVQTILEWREFITRLTSHRL